MLRLTGPDAALRSMAEELGGSLVLPTMKSEVLHLERAMLTGYLVGILTVIDALGGDTITWLALIGNAGALVPPLVAFWVGIKVFGLSSVISDGATTGARNSTPGLTATLEGSGSSVAAVPYPVACAFTTVLALIGGYFSMILS